MHPDMSMVDSILARYPAHPSSLIMILQDIQGALRHLPDPVIERVAEHLGIPRTEVYGVATFYKVFTREPLGRTVVHVCKGTACHVRGAQLIEEALSRELGIAPGETSADGAFTLRTVNCVGACAMAPVVIANDTYHAEVEPARVARLVKRWRSTVETTEQAERGQATRETPRFGSAGDLEARVRELGARRASLPGEVRVCGGPGCLAAGSEKVLEALRAAGERLGVPLVVSLEDCFHAPERRHLALTGCQGLCQQGPLVHVSPGDTLYRGVKPAHAEAIVQALRDGRVAEELAGEPSSRHDHPFYQGQVARALRTCGWVDPEDLNDYLSVGGFLALAHAIQRLAPGDVVDRVDASGLRGRGGAGFPTGRKWRSAIAAAGRAGTPPYVLCNGDEGDPGAFMDRVIMEGSPYQVVEGMILGAYALGAREGYIYVRHEYPLAVKRLEAALETCRRAGLLGERILGTDLCFDIRISRGGGAFVCGESTALMRSLEGKVGEPRAKYVRSVERGLYDRPTVLNNVETWALVPEIVRDGPESLASLGTEGSRGTKAFSLSGSVQRTGLVEVPMGTTLRQLIFDIGGGPPPGRKFKAVQTGGPSGGCLPESHLDLPIDFEALERAGSMMGSGGMIVMDDRTCMVDVARYFVSFLETESCGKCAPCRLGLPQLSYLLGLVQEGRATSRHLEEIEDVCRGMAESSLCGLGKSAPNPVLSTLKYFREEYEAHLEGRCPAGVCKALIRYEIEETCTGCLLCIDPCPVGAISGEKGLRHVIDDDLCTRCGICQSVCNYDAVKVVSGGRP